MVADSGIDYCSSQRKNKPQLVLGGSFLSGLDEFLAKLCQHVNYLELTFHEVDEVRPRLCLPCPRTKR